MIETRLTPTESQVYRLTEAPIAMETLRKRCLAWMDYGEFDRSLARLDQLGLIFQEGAFVVGLALPKVLGSHQASSIEALRSRSQDEFLDSVGTPQKHTDALVQIST